MKFHTSSFIAWKKSANKTKIIITVVYNLYDRYRKLNHLVYCGPHTRVAGSNFLILLATRTFTNQLASFIIQISGDFIFLVTEAKLTRVEERKGRLSSAIN